MKILADMSLTPRWVGIFRAANIAASHWSPVGSADATDAEIMRVAAEDGLVVLTHDLDFSAILAATKRGRPSVVQIRAKDINRDVIGARVMTALKQVEQEIETGALLTIDTDRMRLRLLPL